MEKFKAGEVVQLASGGPKMTVWASLTTDKAFCRWFSGDMLVEGDEFPNEVLRKADPDISGKGPSAA